jgi:hypothetical protein
MLALLRVKEKVIAIVSKRQSTNGAEQRKSNETIPVCTRRSAFRATHDITSGMTDEAGKKSTAVGRLLPGREAVDPDCIQRLVSVHYFRYAEKSRF